ncbi:Co2+/Mg2+ efflux protein ApaG [Candidatus Njordibacter sp. Uisw_039]|jgi:ApaG protein|uniref:Co2+/Mg2+ efflux protein ApaG n=1 Tax=Candidatus Njordibacter sp. Uisw_039 TaxID=3230972 RepID=UPI003A4B4380|tara:strand:- start:4670 stop:5056 length:387 start_codon:yes stop_codon:yes gene_type:complete
MSTLSNNYDLNVGVKTEFLAEQSDPSRNRYVFAYKITITNSGIQSAQLMSRKWIITDGDGKIQEVSGQGIVGQQPIIEPGQQHQYTSGTVLETKVGSMSGSYSMIAADGHEFSALIPSFTLSYPNALH